MATDSSLPTVVSRPMRADARRNYDKLIAAAREAFTEHDSTASLEDIEIPQPVNIFEANPILPNGDIGVETAPTKAGDSVTLRAELDTIVVVTACPQDLTPLCGGTPTSIDIELL